MIMRWPRSAIGAAVCVASALPMFAIPALNARRQAPSSPQAALSSRCSRTFVAGSAEVTVDCTYPAGPRDRTGIAEIALDHAAITFGLRDESRMQVKLTFSNIGGSTFPDVRTAYIEFDDPSGKNYIRRPLPHVDFREIAPGGTATFEDDFLVATLRPGSYVVALWIPSADERFRFQPSDSFLLANVGRPERAAGLNQIATLTITPRQTRPSR